MACGSLLSEEDLCRFRTKKCRRLTSGSCEFGITRCQYSHNQYWSRRCPIYLSDRSFIRYIHVLCPCVTIKPTGDYEGPLPCGKHRCKQLLNCLLNSAAIAALDALPQERRQSQAPYCSSNVRKGGGGGACGKDRDNESCWCPYPGEEVIENTCGRGGECPFAHSIEEILYHPLFYKMVICGNYRKGVCDTYYCPYVHGLAERRRPSEYKLPFTTGIDIPPLPFVTVVTRIEKKKESVAPPLEASLASTASASDGACCSPQTERTDCSISTASGKYAVFFRDRLTCTGQEGPAGRWRKALGRSSSRRSGGTAKRDFHRKGSLPSHLSSASLQATVWNAPVRGETSLLENLEPVAEEVANQSEDFLDACKKRYADAFTKGYADTSVRSFADAFAKGHVDACVKRYADAHGDASANTCTKDPDDAFPSDYTKAHESEGQTVDPASTMAATAPADLFSTSFLPAGSPVGLVGHEVLLNTNLLEGDLTAEALAPFLSVDTLQTNAAADVVSTLPHVQLVAAALELYDKSAAKVRSDEPIGVRANALKNFFGASSGRGPGFGRRGERCLTAQQDASGPSGTTEIGESSIAPDIVSSSCCKGEYDRERGCKGANSDNRQTGENTRSVGELEDVSPTACSPGSSCWLPFLSPCIVSPESSVAEPLTARVRAAGADVLEKLFAGARQCTNEAALGKFAGDTSVPIDTGAVSSPPATSRRVPLPPGIPVSALMFSAPVQHSRTADAAGLHHAIHADCATVSDTTHGKSRRAGASFSQTRAGNVRATDTGTFSRRDDMGAGVPPRGNTTLGTGVAAEEDFDSRQRQNPQKCLSETCTSDKERRRTFCEAEVAQEEPKGKGNKDENAQRIEVVGRKKESDHSTNSGSDTKPLQQEEAAQSRVMSVVSCDMLKGTAIRRENRASQSKREEETDKTEEEPLSDEGEKHNRAHPVTQWTLAGASGSAARLSKPKQEQDVHVMEREEGILAGDDCGCPLAESVLQSLEKSVRILTTTGWKGSVKQLKRMHKAAGELWELIHCGHVSSQAEVTGTSSPDPFSELFSFLDSVGGDCVSQRCTTALSTLLPGKTQPTEK